MGTEDLKFTRPCSSIRFYININKKKKTFASFFFTVFFQKYLCISLPSIMTLNLDYDLFIIRLLIKKKIFDKMKLQRIVSLYLFITIFKKEIQIIIFYLILNPLCSQSKGENIIYRLWNTF